jgi:hypothetical protein
MSEQTYSIDQDLKEAEAMAKALDDYIRDDQLYGQVGGGGLFGGGSMPSLTVGALLMRLRRLRALQDQMNESQRSRMAAIEQQHEAVRREWRNFYEAKLLKEANSRLDAMKTFFEECVESPRSCAGNYLPEALRRTIVQEILLTMPDLNMKSADLDTKVRGTDSRLRRFVQPSDFIWSPDLQAVYPKETFWWLYNKPSKPA